MLKKILKLLKALAFWKKVVPVKIPVKDYGDLFDGKIALVTGGAGGIGFAIAKRLSEARCSVIILARNEEKLKKASEQIGCKYRVLDITKVSDIKRVISEIYQDSSPEILVNCAGVMGKGRFGSIEEEDWDKVINTNVRGTVFMTQEVSKMMIERKIKGHILNLSSSSALRPCYSSYIVSKHLVRDLTQGFAKELIKHGIVVNAIAPGPTATDMIGADESDLVSLDVPAGRMATADEIANHALSLVSEMGDMVVGSTLYVTGGSGITTCE